MSRTPVYLVDASIYIFRAYFSLPERWHSPEGYPLQAVYGYTSFLLELFKSIGEEGEHCIGVAFDESLGTCYRNEIYPEYKCSRELPDEALAYQLKACREVTERLGLSCYGGERYEADDYIATLAACARQEKRDVMVVSRDKDLGQLLLREGDRLWDFAAAAKFSRQDFFQRFGVQPEQFADYQGLAGDAVDDIPGVPSVGAKTAARLIDAFGDLESLEKDRDRVAGLGLRGAARIQAHLEEYWEQAVLSRDLARLESEIPGLQALPADYALTADSLDSLTEFLDSIDLRGGVAGRVRTLADRLRG